LAGYPDGRRYEAEVLRRISDLELNDCVEVRIDISEREKFALLAGATAVVVPSPVEGFSLCAIEGNIAGTPAVVSDGVPNDVVADLDNGLRYPSGDIHA